jgi:AcrR family transcriptional regulator
MPATRHGRPRPEKAAELLAIAERLFRERGYNGTTMAAIAAEAGVASNVVHWYFPSKDELFAKALEELQIRGLDELLDRQLARATPGEEKKTLEEVLTRLVWRVLDGHHLIATVHERANQSEVIDALHERAHRRYAHYLGRAVSRCGVPEAERELVVEALSTALEGLVMHRASKRKARRMISFLVERLTAEP